MPRTQNNTTYVHTFWRFSLVFYSIQVPVHIMTHSVYNAETMFFVFPVLFYMSWLEQTITLRFLNPTNNDTHVI